jgi:CheY-like chemotaxis protein
MSLSARTILLVEDNNANRMVFQDLLEAEGHHVCAVATAQEAVAMARQVIPDLILMDVQLEGMDGLSAARLLRQEKETREIPIVALTSYAMPGDREKALVAGCNGYISKPIRIREFRRSIQEFLNPPAAKDGA